MGHFRLDNALPANTIPDPVLIVLIGAAGSGKSTWARNRPSTQVWELDRFRAMVSDEFSVKSNLLRREAAELRDSVSAGMVDGRAAAISAQAEERRRTARPGSRVIYPVVGGEKMLKSLGAEAGWSAARTRAVRAVVRTDRQRRRHGAPKHE